MASAKAPKGVQNLKIQVHVIVYTKKRLHFAFKAFHINIPTRSLCGPTS